MKIPPRNNTLHPDDRRDDDYYRILRDIDENRFDSLRTKYRALIGEVKDGGPEDKSEEIGKLAYARLCAEGVLPRDKDSVFSKWKTGNRWPFEAAHAANLLTYCWSNTYWSPIEWRRRRAANDPNAYFYTLTEKMRCERTTHQNLLAAAPGIYQVWSNSVVLPGRYVFGLFAVYEDCGTIKTLEIHRLPVIKDENGIIIQPALEEISSGYMVKKSQQIMIHAFDLITRLFKFTSIIDTLRGTDDDGKLSVMKAIDFQIIGQNHFSRAKIFLRESSIEDVLKVRENLKCEVKTQQSFDLSKKDEEILQGMMHLEIYSHLSLMTNDSVPDFVKVQLVNIMKPDF